MQLESESRQGQRLLSRFLFAIYAPALLLLIGVAVTYAYFAVRVCGGLDSSGYLNAASLIASGQ